MQNTEKIRSSGQVLYDNLLEGVAEYVMAAICANRMTPFQVFMRYTDNAYEHEGYHEWLEIEYPKPAEVTSAQEDVRIPSYTSGDDIIVMFENLPRRDGTVDDEYLRSVGSVSVTQTVSVE